MCANLSKQISKLIFGRRAGVEASRSMGWLANIPLPLPILNPLIQLYSMGFGVDMQGVKVPPEGFNSFGDFFARRSRADARPIAKGSLSMVAGLSVGEPNSEMFSIMGYRTSRCPLPFCFGLFINPHLEMTLFNEDLITLSLRSLRSTSVL